MRLEDRALEVEEVQLTPEAPAVSVIDLEPLALDIAAAVETAGPEVTVAALAQVQSGVTSPEALLVWIDDLRDPEQRGSDVDPADQQEGVIPDFIKDTQLASGAADAPPSAGNAGIETPPRADEDYFFSAIRRRRLDDDRHASPLSPLDPDTIAAADKEKTTSGTKAGVARAISALHTPVYLSLLDSRRAPARRATELDLSSHHGGVVMAGSDDPREIADQWLAAELNRIRLMSERAKLS